MITAGVLLRLQDDGLLDIDAPVAAVAPWGAGTRRSRRPSCCRTARASSVCCRTRDTAVRLPVLAAGTLQDCAASIFTTRRRRRRRHRSRHRVPLRRCPVASRRRGRRGRLRQKLGAADRRDLRPAVRLTTLGTTTTSPARAVTFSYPTAFTGDPASCSRPEPEHGRRRLHRSRRLRRAAAHAPPGRALRRGRCCPRPRSTACTPTASARRTPSAPACRNALRHGLVGR